MTALAVGVVESMCHAMQSVIVHCSVVTTVVSHATKSALHARKAVATTASTATARRNVVNHVILVTRNVTGVACIINAQDCVGSFATVLDAMSRVRSHLPAGIPVSVSVGKYARASAENVTKTR